MIELENLTKEDVQAVKGDDKLLLVIELRTHVTKLVTGQNRTTSIAAIAEATGLSVPTIRNFADDKITLPQPGTITALLKHVAPQAPKKHVSFELSEATKEKIRSRTQSWRKPRPLRRSQQRAMRRRAS